VLDEKEAASPAANRALLELTSAPGTGDVPLRPLRRLIGRDLPTRPLQALLAQRDQPFSLRPERLIGRTSDPAGEAKRLLEGRKVPTLLGFGSRPKEQHERLSRDGASLQLLVYGLEVFVLTRALRIRRQLKE